MPTQITPANGDDLPAILGLLKDASLPQAGLADCLLTTFVARDGSTIVGCAALELYGTAALLRSVAVAPARRGQGLGQALTHALLGAARRLGMTSVYLLTETAATFFPRLGFRPVDRALVPAKVRQSDEFTHLCPASAQVLMIAVAPEPEIPGAPPV